MLDSNTKGGQLPLPTGALLELDVPLEDCTPLPRDDVPDAQLSPSLVQRRAEERYPLRSLVVPGPNTTLRNAFTHDAQQRFRSTLARLDPRIVAKLNQPFGKENLRQCFRAEAALRHVLVPLWWSGFLAGNVASWNSLCAAYYPARLLRELLRDYGDVKFFGAKGYNPNWEKETEVDKDRVAMNTAAVLYFSGSVADTVRWLGGPHVADYRPHAQTLQKLRESDVDDRVVADLSRILYDGIPAQCNVSSTEKNFSAYFEYGNHSTVEDVPEKTYKAMVKDARKGFTLLLDERVILLLLHCHVTPQGIVDLNTLHKNPRPIFDSSFRPHPWCFAINDWTHKDNEPPLTFAGAEMGFMIWLYNLRITYPHEEIYLADDDVSGAFRLMKYHPNLMALHTSRQCGYCVINTGGTFGDNTSPSNFDPLGLARRQLAHYLWVHDQSACERILPYLPPLQRAPTPSPEEVATFVPADVDGINVGVLGPNGERKPPPYNMHVDDALYGDVGEFLEHTICTSVSALFWVLGEPTDPLVPSPLSFDKFEAYYNHTRKMVGRRFNSRTLSVGMLDYKREQLSSLLADWAKRERFELLEIAQLLGSLENHTRYARWARCWYFALQNAVRRILHARYKILERLFKKAGLTAKYLSELPSHLAHRVSNLVSRDRAKLLWTARQSYPVDAPIRAAIVRLSDYVDSADSPWEVPLGMIIPREPHFFSRGDASHSGGGAYCERLRYWFDIVWSPRVVRGVDLTPSAADFVHINSLEFIVVILQLAATKVRLEETPKEVLVEWFGGQMPDIPVWFGETDNTVSRSWENRATSRSVQGQGLVAIYAELLRTTRVHTQCMHLAGKLNVVADDISRNDFSLPLGRRAQQLYPKHPCLEHLDYFQPSAELIQLLTLRLYSRHSLDPCVLPKDIGRFLPVSSTTSISVIL